MSEHGMAPFGRALLAFHRGDATASFTLMRDDGLETDVSMAIFFRAPAEFSAIERAALDACRGHVLDVGAGSGIHSLACRERGLSVTAIDASADAVTVLRERGLDDVRQIELFDFTGGPFDSILLLGHGIGMVESLAGLDRFCALGRRLLSAGGQVLVHSVDVRRTDDPVHLAYHEWNRRKGRYVGEIHLRFAYRGEVGAPVTWLHVDPGTLRRHAEVAGWACDVLIEQDDGEYLARLVPES